MKLASPDLKKMEDENSLARNAFPEKEDQRNPGWRDNAKTNRKHRTVV